MSDQFCANCKTYENADSWCSGYSKIVEVEETCQGWEPRFCADCIHAKEGQRGHSGTCTLQGRINPQYCASWKF